MTRPTTRRRDYVAEFTHGLYDVAGCDPDESFLTTTLVQRLNGREVLKRHVAQEGISGEALDSGIRARWLGRFGLRREHRR